MHVFKCAFTMNSPLYLSQLAYTVENTSYYYILYKILYISCAEHGTSKQIIAMERAGLFQYVTKI